MSSPPNTSLRKAVDDLSQVLSSSLGPNEDCMQAIANIEAMLNSIEHKLNGSCAGDESETLSFVPEPITQISNR